MIQSNETEQNCIRAQTFLEHLLEAAKKYFELQVNVVAVKQKKPLTEWAQWQTQKQTKEEFENQPWQCADGFGIICGTKAANQLYFSVVDFDVKNVSEQAQEMGKEILKKLLCTQIEMTPSGGQHWIYQTHNKPPTNSSHHSECGLELLGEGKLCIMAPSQGYQKLNDNIPSILNDLEDELYQAMHQANFRPKVQSEASDAWFSRSDLNAKRFVGKAPPCIEALYRGVKEGERNENTMRLASYLANFCRTRPDHVLEQMRKLNKLNEPPLPDKELQGIIKSAVNGGYMYGCQDPILKIHCNREQCLIAPTNTQKPLTQQETQNAETILKESNLLKDALAYGKQRLLGEDNALLSNFVMFCSGRSRYPISGVVSGFSGSGKNESIRGIKPLIPKEWYFEFTTSTPEAMKYLPEEFDGTIVIYEALGVKGDSGSLSLRAIGEGESIETIYPMRNELTGKMEMGRAKTNAKNFITTSSDIDINADLYRRVLKHTMNHSTQLTKRVMAKKIRDSAYPESLRKALGIQKTFDFQEEDFQNALRLLNWRHEIIVFAPSQLLGILDLAAKREQEVALRTHLEKILHFTRVLALINQRKRIHAKLADSEYVIADPQDLLLALDILHDSIAETISRIEKRQEEVLSLFSYESGSLTKHDVAERLKITTKTAAKALKTLASGGYLKEENGSNRTYHYTLLQEKPNYLALVGSEHEIRLFYQQSLKNWLNSIFPAAHSNGDPWLFNPKTTQWTSDPTEITNTNQPQTSGLEKPNPPTQPKEDGKAPSDPKDHSFIGNTQNHLLWEDKGSQKSSDPPESCPQKVDTQYLSLKTKELTRLPPDYEVNVESCVVCGVKQRPDWRFTLFDDSWGFLCGRCGFKLSQKLTTNN